MDKPLASFKFLATSFTRSFREFKPERSIKQVRKHVQTAAQVYWQGQFYTGEATEIGASGLRLRLDQGLQAQDVARMKQEKPLVGLLLSSNDANNRLLAQISDVEVLPEQTSVVIELQFPAQFKQKQGEKIKELLQTL